MKAPLVRITEGALANPLFRRLKAAVVALGTERLRSTYQTTFWFDLGAPAGVAEQSALAVAEHLPSRRRVKGAEWWLSRMRTTNVQVDFHRDRDNRLALEGGPERHPVWSTVLFLNRCRGGLLAVTEQDPDENNPARAPLPLDGDLVEPWPNRLAVFRGDLTHGVLDAHNHIPHRRLPGTPPLRLALIVNFWDERPRGVPRLAETRHYRGLR